MTPERVRDLAMELASLDFEERVDKILEASGGSPDVLTRASHLVSGISDTAASPEHIAFTYLAAAFGRVSTA